MKAWERDWENERMTAPKEKRDKGRIRNHKYTLLYWNWRPNVVDCLILTYPIFKYCKRQTYNVTICCLSLCSINSNNRKGSSSNNNKNESFSALIQKLYLNACICECGRACWFLCNMIPFTRTSLIGIGDGGGAGSNGWWSKESLPNIHKIENLLQIGKSKNHPIQDFKVVIKCTQFMVGLLLL